MCHMQSGRGMLACLPFFFPGFCQSAYTLLVRLGLALKVLMNWSTQYDVRRPRSSAARAITRVASRTASAILVLDRDYPTIVVAGARLPHTALIISGYCALRQL